jgi:N-acetylglucosaminyldiphosphoundecaprenol N-acetyl-beta-D-mannosaminyltransferase
MKYVEGKDCFLIGKDKKRYRIGSVHISATNPKDAKERITMSALNGEGGYVCVSNLRMIRHAGRHPDYAELMGGSLMNFPDGKPLKWCARLWGQKDVETTNGPAFFKAMLADGDGNLKHYLLGDTQDVLDRIKERNEKELHANIVGAEALPFANVEEFDYENISNRIKASGANVVWTAMRAPKQDEFNQRLFAHLPHVVCLGVGRAFRLLIGEVKDAPGWAHKAGIAGVFTRKVSLWKALRWYAESSLYLLGYFLQICWRRVRGRRCNE